MARVTSSLVLHANLGAEEGHVNAVLVAKLSSFVASWATLFGGRATVDGAPHIKPLPDVSPAFSFLPVDGFVPWYATGATRARAATLGLVHRAPDDDATAHVHDKAFAVRTAMALGHVPDVLAAHVVVLEPEDLRAPDLRDRLNDYAAHLPAFVRGEFTLKPRFGTSGRGRVKARHGAIDDAVIAGAANMTTRGGAVLEPWLDRVVDLSGHAVVLDDGPQFIGAVEQLTKRSGGFTGARVVVDESGAFTMPHPAHATIRGVTLDVAAAAGRAGYRGVIGVDAFVFLVDGAETLRPLVEVNARYTGGLIALGRARQTAARDGTGGTFVFDVMTGGINREPG